MDRIASPRTDDEGIEGEIRAKGLTAPRITPADIEANIASANYFTAMDGKAGEEETRSTVLHVGTFGALSLAQPSLLEKQQRQGELPG